jgi:hypothetical protein
MSLVGKRIWGGFAAALGDRAVDWATQANLEHLPGYAHDPASIALIASERLMDTARGEAAGSIAARAPFQMQIGKFYGTPLGLLLGLYFAGFPGAVVVQQNGNAFNLTLPLPAFALGSAWDPTPNLVTTALNTNPFVATSVLPGLPVSAGGAARTAPVLAAGSVPWWVFDSSSLDLASLPGQFTSRFAVLFPGSTFPSSFTTWATASFTGSQDTVDVAWNNVFPDTTYRVLVGPPIIFSGGPVLIDVVDGTNKSTTGITVRTSAPFNGSVDVLAYQVGANPWADPHPSDLSILRSTIQKWKPAKAKCTGIHVAVQGQCWGWPLTTWGTRTWGPATIVRLSP